MKIKIQKYKKFDGDGPVKGVCSISLDVDSHSFVVNGIRVIQSKNGFFYGMPQKKYTDDEGKDCYSAYCGFFDRDSSTVFHKKMTEAFKVFFKNRPSLHDSSSSF